MNNEIGKRFNILEKLDEIKKPYYGFIFVFDLSNKKSLYSCLDYYQEVRKIENEKIKNKEKKFWSKKIIVGCKNDKKILIQNNIIKELIRAVE